MASRIEYPLNVFTTVTWSYSQTTIIAGATWAESDTVSLTVPIPDNAMFWVRLQQSSSSGIIFQDLSSALGDPGNPKYLNRAINNGLGETNHLFPQLNPVLTGTAFQHENGNGTKAWLIGTSNDPDPVGAYTPWVCMRPLAILGQTRKPSFSFYGDSRVVGLGDTYDGVSNDRGEVERSIGPTSAYINFGISGQPANDYATFLGDGVSTYAGIYAVNLAKKYTTNMIEDLGGADCISLEGTDHESAAATVKNSKIRIWTAWTNLTSAPSRDWSSISTLTMPCVATAHSGGFTTTDQYGAAGNGNIESLNSLLRTGDARFPVHVLDIAPVVSQRYVGYSGEEYLWIPHSPAYTVEGIHEGQAACYAIQNSGIIDTCILCQQ